MLNAIYFWSPALVLASGPALFLVAIPAFLRHKELI